MKNKLMGMLWVLTMALWLMSFAPRKAACDPELLVRYRDAFRKAEWAVKSTDYYMYRQTCDYWRMKIAEDYARRQFPLPERKRLRIKNTK